MAISNVEPHWVIIDCQNHLSQSHVGTYWDLLDVDSYNGVHQIMISGNHGHSPMLVIITTEPA